MSDRPMEGDNGPWVFDDPSTYGSLWSSNEWTGGVAFNDGSTSLSSTPLIENTRYANFPAFTDGDDELDNLFLRGGVDGDGGPAPNAAAGFGTIEEARGAFMVSNFGGDVRMNRWAVAAKRGLRTMVCLQMVNHLATTFFSRHRGVH